MGIAVTVTLSQGTGGVVSTASIFRRIYTTMDTAAIMGAIIPRRIAVSIGVTAAHVIIIRKTGPQGVRGLQNLTISKREKVIIY